MEAQEASDEAEAIHSTLMSDLELQVLEIPDDPALRLQLGLLLWETSGVEGLGMKEKAAEHFVVSAKLDPHNGVPFKYLGHYFSRFSIDVPRSIKCYQRAISLNPDDSEAGEPLCALLDQSGKESLQISLCNDASQKSPVAFWAFKRMGFLYLHRKNYTQAVHCLQHAIRGYPTNPQLWEALGNSYHHLGMFTAASKSYARAIELDGSCVLALVESGNIFAMLGSYSKAVDQFRLALNVAPRNVAVNYGLSSSLLSWSNECMSLGAYSWGTSLLEEASNAVHEAIGSAGNLFSLWKLHGDIKLSYGKCFPWIGEDLSFVDDAGFKSSILSWRKCCSLAAESARSSYQRALHLAPWNANLYSDVALSSELSSIAENDERTTTHWRLPEKMVMGALLLESCNFEFWVALGQVTHRNSLKQHSFIRGLQLNLSSATTWAFIGMLYREEGEFELSRHSFDCARSMDPSLALPWAGVSADAKTMDQGSENAFECCLRAVQNLPLPEFQVGLAKLAFVSGHLASPQVYSAIHQAIKRAPHYPESHNLKGLICESRQNYEAAIKSYKLALSAIRISFGNCSMLHVEDIVVNLTRCLSKANYPADCVEQCQSLKVKGMLDEQGQQLLALSLWQLEKKKLAISVITEMSMSPLEPSSMALIFRLLYRMSGIDAAIDFMVKLPTDSLKNCEVGMLIYAASALDETDRLLSLISRIRASNLSHDQKIEAHYLSATAKLLKHESGSGLAFTQGITRLKKALHLYPESNFLRNYLGKLLLSNEECNDGQLSRRCCAITENCASFSYEIVGATTLSCHSLGFKSSKFTFPTCACKASTEVTSVAYLQRRLREEPSNNNVRYLLILSLYQKSREEKFPRNLLIALQRLLNISLTNTCDASPYQKFHLLLCASETSLQCRDLFRSIEFVNKSLSLKVPENCLFFAHFFLCRLYSAQQNFSLANRHFLECVTLETNHHIGWVCLLALQLQYKQQLDSTSLVGLMLKNCPKSHNMLLGIANLLQGLYHFQQNDLLLSEAFLSQSAALCPAEPCVFLSHGVVCMALAREERSGQWMESCERSIAAAMANSAVPLPIVRLLEAQASGSLGDRERWESAVGAEWYSWPPDKRHAEVLFQMHLIAGKDCRVKWVLRAVHANPSCHRYWAALGLSLTSS